MHGSERRDGERSMTRTALTLVLLAAALGTAAAQRPIEIIERSYELEIGDVVFPVTQTGTVTVKPCPDCSSVVHAVDASTTYLLNRMPVPYEEFMQAVGQRRLVSSEPTSVGVYYDVETKRVKRILLSYAAR